MKLTLLSFLVFAILGVFMMPGKAMAHEGYSYDAQPNGAVQNTHATSEALTLKAATVVVKSASVASSSQDSNCKGGCCSSMGACCFAAAIPPYFPDMHIVRDAFYAGLPELSLPQGPPSSLLRPPRFSA